MKTILSITTSILTADSISLMRARFNRWPRRPALPHVGLAIALAWFGLSPAARAVEPPPDGGYPGENTAEGDNALFSLTTGIFNTATGESTLFNNTTGFNNTAIGWHAVENNTTGGTNTGIGCDALDGNTTGGNNIAVGFRAGEKLTTGNNNIDIGNRGVAGESNTIRIGTKSTHRSTFIAGISGATVPNGIGVVVDTSGHLGTVVSSERFKDQIRPMDKTSEAILQLRPVTFCYKHELDPDRIPQFGLVAEQVQKVNPALVVRDDRGKAYSVRYEAVNAMLLNEFFKEHRKVEEQEATITQVKSRMAKQETAITEQNNELRTTIAQQQEQIKALTAILKEQATQIQQVSDQLRVSKAAPRFVVNNQ